VIIGTPFFVIALLIDAGHSAHAPAASAIEKVAIAPEFFNPSLGQVAKIVYTTTDAGAVTLAILDRDGFPIRRLPPATVEKGNQEVVWDGRDDDGTIVPDEAYTFRIALKTTAGVVTYDPGAGFHPLLEDPPGRAYSAINGVLSYRLTRTSRVHVQAGHAVADPKSGGMAGPVLKTLVDRQPRIAGAVVEKWAGYDESGTIHVPTLKNFVISIFAASLPENSLITVGNKAISFAAYVQKRRPPAALKPRPGVPLAHRTHHADLNALEDRSPKLRLETGARRDSAGRVVVGTGELKIVVSIPPAEAHHFLSRKTRLDIFVDTERVVSIERPTNPSEVNLKLEALGPGVHVLAANWVSNSGPVAANAVRVVADETKTAVRGGP